MSDDELIRYCAAHAQTERALFNGDHINRMFELAGYTPGTWIPMKSHEWASMKGSMLELVGKAQDIREYGPNFRKATDSIVAQFAPATPPRRSPTLRLVVDNTKGN